MFDNVSEMLNSLGLGNHFYTDEQHGTVDGFESHKNSLQSYMTNNGDTIIFIENGTLMKPNGTEPLDTIKVFGQDILLPNGSTRITTTPISAIADERGSVIGDYAGNLIALHFNPEILGELAQAKVYLYLLAQSGHMNKQRALEFVVRESMPILDKMVVAISKERETKLIGIDNDIRSFAEQKKKYEEEAKIWNNRYNLKKQLKESISDHTKIAVDTIEAQLKQISEFPFVESIRRNDNGLLIMFKEAKYRGNNYGKYTLSIVTDMSMNGLILRAWNQELHDKRTVSGSKLYQHPHIDTNNGICFGDLGDEIRDTLAIGNLVTVVSAFWAVINSYNARQPHIKLTGFMRVLELVRHNKPVEHQKGEPERFNCSSCGGTYGEDDWCFDCDRCRDCCNCEDEDGEPEPE